jgi:cytidylate kinase
VQGVRVSETPTDRVPTRHPRQGSDRPSARDQVPVGYAVDPGPDELVKVVALDGPAGTGKSSVSRQVARVLGWRFVDTGATYRAVTLAVLRAGADPADPIGVLAAARSAEVELTTDPENPGVRLDGIDVSAEIRSPEVTAQVSAVSAVPAVRSLLIALQRRAMGTDGAVVEGRDIATVVAPRAAVKVYLDARPEVRAQRRASETQTGGHVTPAEAIAHAVERDLLRRDTLDNQTNLLQVSDGAVHVDTSDLTLEEVVQVIVRLVRDTGLVPG